MVLGIEPGKLKSFFRIPLVHIQVIKPLPIFLSHEFSTFLLFWPVLFEEESWVPEIEPRGQSASITNRAPGCMLPTQI